MHRCHSCLEQVPGGETFLSPFLSKWNILLHLVIHGRLLNPKWPRQLVLFCFVCSYLCFCCPQLSSSSRTQFPPGCTKKGNPLTPKKKNKKKHWDLNYSFLFETGKDKKGYSLVGFPSKISVRLLVPSPQIPFPLSPYLFFWGFPSPPLPSWADPSLLWISFRSAGSHNPFCFCRQLLSMSGRAPETFGLVSSLWCLGQIQKNFICLSLNTQGAHMPVHTGRTHSRVTLPRGAPMQIHHTHEAITCQIAPDGCMPDYARRTHAKLHLCKVHTWYTKWGAHMPGLYFYRVTTCNMQCAHHAGLREAHTCQITQGAQMSGSTHAHNDPAERNVPISLKTKMHWGCFPTTAIGPHITCTSTTDTLCIPCNEMPFLLTIGNFWSSTNLIH